MHNRHLNKEAVLNSIFRPFVTKQPVTKTQFVPISVFQPMKNTKDKKHKKLKKNLKQVILSILSKTFCFAESGGQNIIYSK